MFDRLRIMRPYGCVHVRHMDELGLRRQLVQYAMHYKNWDTDRMRGRF